MDIYLRYILDASENMPHFPALSASCRRLYTTANRYNSLLPGVTRQLVDLKKAVKGLVVVTPELEEISQALLQGKVTLFFTGTFAQCVGIEYGSNDETPWSIG